MDHVMYTVASH